MTRSLTSHVYYLYFSQNVPYQKTEPCSVKNRCTLPDKSHISANTVVFKARCKARMRHILVDAGRDGQLLFRFTYRIDRQSLDSMVEGLGIDKQNRIMLEHNQQIHLTTHIPKGNPFGQRRSDIWAVRACLSVSYIRPFKT